MTAEIVIVGLVLLFAGAVVLAFFGLTAVNLARAVWSRFTGRGPAPSGGRKVSASPRRR